MFIDEGDRFDAKEFKEFKLGYKNREVILKELLGLVDMDADGCISYEEFFSFYTDLGLNLPADEGFCKFVGAQWNCKPSLGPVTKAEEIKTALRTIRFKLLQRTGNTHEEFILRKVFCEFDANKNGKMGTVELGNMLVKLEIPTEERLLEGIVARIDRNGDGEFDFDEFSQFVFYNPYHI